MTTDTSRFHQVFFEESLEGLDSMEQELLAAVPGNVDAETVNAIFRVAHTIKGGAATFGFHEIADFSHRVETLLDQMRSGKRELDPAAIELLLGVVDLIRMMIEGARSGTGSDSDAVAAYTERLEQALSAKVPAQPATTETSPAPVTGTIETGGESITGWRIHFSPDPSILAHGNDVVLMFRELARMGELQVMADLSALPSLPELDAEQCFLSWQIELHAQVERVAVEEVFEWVADDSELTIEPLSAASSKDISATDSMQTENKQSAVVASTGKRLMAEHSGSIRVDIDKMDALVDLVGELVITQSMLNRLRSTFPGIEGEQLDEGLNRLERHTRDLQEGVLEMRMLPIAFVFNRFPRMVRDLAATLGKQVTLAVHGETTELDKTVMEAIGDPLMHLVRNAIDHGLEDPQSRLAAGKSETGSLILSAYHQSGNVYVEVRDDGRGIDAERIIESARRSGQLSDEASVEGAAVWNLMFLPGVSTATEVSDISGRGVGLDVVNRNIRSLGGSITVDSEVGQGSTFTIRMPLTLAILDGQLIKVSDDIYIIPLEVIIDTIQLEPAHLSSIADWLELYPLRDQYIPVIHLAQLFHRREMTVERPLLVMVEYEGRRVGLAVEQLAHQQQVVIKSLEANFVRVEGISAATILGDGTVGLILDIGGLIHLAEQEWGRTADTGMPYVDTREALS